MTIAVNIHIDEASLNEAREILRAIPRGFPRVMQRATSRTATFARVRFARIIAKDLKINVGDAKDTVHINFIPPYGRSIDASAYPYRLIDLDPRQTAEGVSYLAYRGAKRRETLKHAFIATGPKRGRQVWLRSLYRLGRRKYIEWKGRKMEAIFAMRGGKTPWKSLQDNPVEFADTVNQVGPKLQKEVNSQIGVELRRWAK